MWLQHPCRLLAHSVHTLHILCANPLLLVTKLFARMSFSFSVLKVPRIRKPVPNCAKEVGSMFQINIREDVYLIMCTFLLVVYTHAVSLH